MKDATIYQTNKFKKEYEAAHKAAWAKARAEGFGRDKVAEIVRAEMDFEEIRATVPGRIGSGTKVHNLSVTYAVKDGVRYIMHASSHCGSQKFTLGGYSRLTILPEGTEVTCKKC
jgi:hypothetical protein